MGALMKKGATESGANDLMGMMDKLPGGLDLGNVAGLLSNQDQSKTLLNSGNGLVSSLLGGGNNKMFDLISSVSGIGRAKSGNLMGLLMPIAMNMLRGKMRGGGLGPAGLASMLLGQRNFLKAAAPNGLTEALGLSSFDDIGGNIGHSANVNVGVNDAARNVGGAVQGGVDNVRGAAGNVGGAVTGAVGAGAAATAAAGGKVARGGMGIGRWLLPLLGLILLGLLLWWLFNNFLGGNRNATPNVNTPTGNVTSTVNNAADATTGAVSGAANAAGNAANNAAGAAAGAVAGAIPANILSGVCGNVSGLTSSLGAFPALSADTETSALATGVNAIRTPIEAIIGAAGETAIPGLGALTEGFNGLRGAVDAITGTTLGASAGAVSTAFDGLKGAGDTFTNGLNCNN